MFEHFTFGAQAQTLNYQHEEDIDISASPTDCSFPPPRMHQPPTSYCDIQQGGILDIVHKFSQQLLLNIDENERPQQSVWQGQSDTLPTPDFEEAMPNFSPEDMTYHSTSRGMVQINHFNAPSTPPLSPTPQNGTVACRRLQRQLNVQLQTSASHTKDIDALVSNMISSSSQCTLHTSPIRSYPSSPPKPEALVIDPMVGYEGPIPDDDEGFAEMEDVLSDIENFRRARTSSGIRKYSSIRMRPSVEGLNNKVIIDVNGKIKVRSVPRMRRRKPKKPREKSLSE